MFFKKKKKDTCANLTNNSDCNLVNEIKNLQKSLKEKEKELDLISAITDAGYYENYWYLWCFFRSEEFKYFTRDTLFNRNALIEIDRSNFELIIQAIKRHPNFEGLIQDFYKMKEYDSKEEALKKEINNLKEEIKGKKKQLGID